MTGIPGSRIALVTVAVLVAACVGRPASTPSASTPIAGAAVEGPLLIALVEATKAAGTLSVIGSNGTHQTWRSADGIGLTFDRGVLFATRGLGADLYTSETGPVLDAWPAGTYTRTLRHLDGENHVVATRLACQLADHGMTEIVTGDRTHAVGHAVETCRATGLPSIRNDYWREADGTMRQSRQWIAPALGHITVQRIGG